MPNSDEAIDALNAAKLAAAMQLEYEATKKKHEKIKASLDSSPCTNPAPQYFNGNIYAAASSPDTEWKINASWYQGGNSR